MIDIPSRALMLGVAGAVLATIPSTPAAAAAQRPKLTVLCLAPGGTGPMPCGVARRNSLLELASAGGTVGDLVFSEIDSIGPPKIVRVPLAARQGGGSAVRLSMPQQLCYAGVDRWRVRLENGPAQKVSIGSVTVRC